MIVSKETAAHGHWQFKARNVGQSGGEHGGTGFSPGLRTLIIAVDSFVSVERVAITAPSTDTAPVLSSPAQQEDLTVECCDLK